MYSSDKPNNKKKIFNDPVYGFISIPGDFIFDLIEHPYMQRLRRINQLGLTHLVYPGAVHSRFHHVLGAMHLMTIAVSMLRRKGVEITDDEEEAVLAAILLHDIGHGPFSHALEYDIVSNVSHESISIYFIEELNKQFDGRLDLCLLLFKNEYHKKPFLYQLVSSQLDMDRLDYLNRDSFYTGVAEGQIGSDRIIEMINVIDGKLVLEQKAVYSIEKFLVSRRFMYWQVYLHKTVVSAEKMLIYVLRRAKELALQGVPVFASPAMSFFLTQVITKEDFENNPAVLQQFANLDDSDIISAIKTWQSHPDTVLSLLSRKIIDRKLFKIEISKTPFGPDRIQLEKEIVRNKYDLQNDEVDYFVYADHLVNNAYSQKKQNINVLMKNGEVMDVSNASDNFNISALTKPVEKFFLCYPL